MAVVINMAKRYAYLQFRDFPYFKVQWYDERSLCWRDIQKAHATEAEARKAFLPEHTCRVMCIEETTRYPLPSP